MITWPVSIVWQLIEQKHGKTEVVNYCKSMENVLRSCGKFYVFVNQLLRLKSCSPWFVWGLVGFLPHPKVTPFIPFGSLLFLGCILPTKWRGGICFNFQIYTFESFCILAWSFATGWIPLQPLTVTLSQENLHVNLVMVPVGSPKTAAKISSEASVPFR